MRWMECVRVIGVRRPFLRIWPLEKPAFLEKSLLRPCFEWIWNYWKSANPANRCPFRQNFARDGS